MSSLRDYLNDILQYANDIADFTQTGETAFNTDRKTQLAVMRAYEVIGEIVKRLPQTLLDTQPDIDWRAIKGFRDVLIHQYDNVDIAIVWDAVKQLPELQSAVSALLASLPPEPDEAES